MNEIEKMYKNAGIEQIKGQEWVCKNPYHCTYQNLSIVPENCSRCKSFQIEMIYPSFTAEKQLSLMTFLINRKVGLSFKAEQGEITVEAISIGLAGIVNRIWQYLTEKEKQQVKGILE